MSDLTLAGVTFNAAQFNNYGWMDPVTVNGTSYIRILALFAAAMSDLGKALTVDATGSINFDTILVDDTGSIALSENRPFRTNAVVTITESGNTGNFILARVTNNVTATTLNFVVLKVTTSSGGGTGTAFTVQIAGEVGPTGTTGAPGAGAPQNGGDKTADFTAVTNTRYTVDCTSAVVATLPAAPDKGDLLIMAKYGSGLLTVDLNGLKYFGSLVDPATTAQGIISLQYTDAGTGWIDL